MTAQERFGVLLPVCAPEPSSTSQNTARNSWVYREGQTRHGNSTPCATDTVLKGHMYFTVLSGEVDAFLSNHATNQLNCRIF